MTQLRLTETVVNYCPSCGEKTQVQNSREIEGTRRRVRKCPVCGHSYATIEVPESVYEEFLVYALLKSINNVKSVRDKRLIKEKRQAD